MSKIAEEKVMKYLEDNKIDGFFISDHTNVKYVSSYTGDDSYLFITKGKKFFITDPRYTEQVSYECPEYEIVEWRSEFGSVPATIAGLAKRHGLKYVAYEADILVVSDYLALEKEGVGLELVPVSGVVEEFRSHKTEKEIAYLRAACDIASRCYERIMKDIRVGITEKELAANLSRYMVLEGSDTMPYGNILISGARTSLLHGIPSEKAVEYGDLVLMDYGCQFHGYMSDMTRTLVVGKATSEQKLVYDIEYRMNEDAEAALKVGATSAEVFEASTKAVKGTKYEPYIYTGIGHGVGLYVHEQPFIGPRHKYTIAENTVLTIEPGIYIPGWGGIRIEDQLLVTENGTENLTWATKELIEL